MQEVAGAPILDYILRALNTPKISEIFILTSRNRKEIEEHLQKYKLNATVIPADKCSSLGDCLREINTRRVLKENFLLIKGSCVLNLNLNAVFESFEAVKAANRETIMLKVFSKSSTLSEIRREGDNPLLVLDKDNTILYFENLQGNTYNLKG
jgi:NDP-sugar pyrophosphorylase family protein